MPEKMDNERGNLNDRLRSFGEEPSPEIWSQLEAKLAAKRRKRALPFWWFLGALMFLSGLVGVAYLWNIQTQMVEQASEVSMKNSGSKSDLGNRKNPSLKPGISDNESKVNQIHSNEKKPNSTERKRIEEQDKPLISTGETRSEPVKGKALLKPSLPNLPFEKRSKPRRFAAEGEEKSSSSRRTKSKSTLALTNNPIPPFAQEMKTEMKTGQEMEPRKEAIQYSDEKARQNEAVSTHESGKEDALKTEPDKESKNPFVLENIPNNPAEKLPIQDSLNKTEVSASKPRIDSAGKPDSAQLTLERNWKKAVYFSMKAPILRQVSINQNPAERRLILTEEGNIWQNRMAFDVGFRMERRIIGHLGVHGFSGFSYLQEQLSIGYSENVPNSYELMAQNEELIVKPNQSFQNGSIQTQRFVGLLAIGLSFEPFQLLVFRASVGTQFRFFEINQSNFGSGIQQKTNGLDLNDHQVFFQGSVGRRIPFQKWNLNLEPMVQYFPKAVFELKSGNRSKPLYFGLSVSMDW